MEASAATTERPGMTTAVDEQQPEVAERALPDLTAQDRCDRCRAQAYVRIVLFSGLDLLFCAHHFAKHEGVLDHYTLRVKDQRDLLDTSVRDGVE